jgi:SAM-dependent methyltransferase
MKTVYYVIAPTASGKTTVAKKLAGTMKLPLCHADSVYDLLRSEYGLPFPASRLCDLALQHILGDTAWGQFANLHEAKLPLLERILPKEGDFIVEGYTLSLPVERELIAKCVGPHRAVLLRIDIPFQVWRDIYLKKFGAMPTAEEYDRLRKFFAARDGDTVYTFRTTNAVDVHYAEYQSADFIAKKIDALKLPIARGDVVNDVGCNEGLIGKWCLDQGAACVRGYDRNWRFLDRAVLNGLEPHLADVEVDDLQPADVTLCVSVFHYFKNPQEFIAKARKSTRRLFVLELPVVDQPGLFSRFEPNNRHWQHSRGLIEFWLNEHFREVAYVGQSVPPDKSYRLVYHCVP